MTHQYTQLHQYAGVTGKVVRVPLDAEARNALAALAYRAWAEADDHSERLGALPRASPGRGRGGRRPYR